MTEKIRIEKVMVHQNMTAGQFASEIGVQNSTLSHILNNRNNPSLDVLKKILSRFPEISTDWLILGQGSMFRQEINSKELTLFDSLDENSSLSINLAASDATNKHKVGETNQNEMLKNQSHVPAEGNKSEQSQRTARIVGSGIPVGSVSPGSQIQNEIGEKMNQAGYTSVPLRIATKVIIYFSDNSFQEFESK